MKKLLLLLVYLFSISIFAQDKGNFSGGFESNTQWYLNDNGLNIAHPEYPFRSNNYLALNYSFKRFSFGLQGEMYKNRALLNFNPEYKNTNVATYFLQYKDKQIDATVGYFYEQFGSGLLFRSWEDRTLGLNNALRGGKIIYKPFDFLVIKGIYGQHRSGFSLSNGKIFGFDSEISISELLNKQQSKLSLGFTYVGRDEQATISEPNFLTLTNAFAGRINFSKNAFYLATEYNFKSNDAVVQVQKINNNFIKPGSAFLFNTGYSKKGFGIDGTFRRLENMSFYSERQAKGNLYNDKIMNFVPSLTKQHHLNLANIYTYQAQPNVSMLDESVLKAGEIGGQIDVFYTFKKGSVLGGKYGTKIAFNASNWFGLKGDYSIVNSTYTTEFMGFGSKYFSDYNFEITKKWNSKWQTIFTLINQYYNKKQIEETYGLIKATILAAEATYKFTPTKSVRVLGEHLWADSDKKNWTSSTIEFNTNSKLSFFISDMYNYGNEDVNAKNHYYNLGGSYRFKATRFAINYGRQRGGLLCVGGICRYVPESSGISLSLSTSF